MMLTKKVIIPIISKQSTILLLWQDQKKEAT